MSEHTDREQLRREIDARIPLRFGPDRETALAMRQRDADAILELIDRRLGVAGSEHTRTDDVDAMIAELLDRGFVGWEASGGEDGLCLDVCDCTDRENEWVLRRYEGDTLADCLRAALAGTGEETT